MASILRSVALPVPAEQLWSAVRDFGAVHTRLAPGFAVGTECLDDLRVVTFAHGGVVREILVAVDDERRRMSYASVGGRASHHNSSMQVEATGPAGCRLDWTTDLLPDELAEPIRLNVERALEAMRAHFAREAAVIVPADHTIQDQPGG